MPEHEAAVGGRALGRSVEGGRSPQVRGRGVRRGIKTIFISLTKTVTMIKSDLCISLT